jgi:hypothetical protein
VSGALVDRLDRRRVMGYVDVCRVALVGALGLAVLFDSASLISTSEVVWQLERLGISEPHEALEEATSRSPVQTSENVPTWEVRRVRLPGTWVNSVR